MKQNFCYLAFLLLAACGGPSKEEKAAAADNPAKTIETPDAQAVHLPQPYATKSVTNRVHLQDWPEGKTPTVPAGFTVTEYARDLDSPRWMYVLPNGDVLVAEANTVPTTAVKETIVTLKLDPSKASRPTSADRITLFRDTNKDGKPDVRETFLAHLDQPLGMVAIGNNFYVANTDGVMRFPYQPGATKITGQGKQILDLPRGGYNNHWTRNLLASPDNSKIYVTVGSGSNVMEHGASNEVRRANILQINPDGSGEKIYASGLRNPVGIDWQPGTKTLWAAVNERDELGDDLVPDYMTSVKEDGFYGWPYSYYGQNEDPRRKGERPDLVKKAIVPDVPLGPHTASLGLAFYTKDVFPAKYHKGAFVGQHGSWNRSAFSGYKVVFVPFNDGKPGKPEDFMTGFLVGGDSKDAYGRPVGVTVLPDGRPVGVTVLPDGSLLVADDAGNRIWRVSAT